MRNVNQQRQLNRQFGIKREKGRHRLCIGTPPPDFHPSGPEDFPDHLAAVEVVLPRCTIEQGVKAARQHNAGQLQAAPADRRWAVVIHGIDQRKRQSQGCGGGGRGSNDGRGAGGDVAGGRGSNGGVGPQPISRHDPRPPAGFTPEEIDRLLAACQNARLPDVANVSPAAWWRALIAVLLATGLGLDTVLAMRRRAIRGGGVAPIGEILREWLERPALTPDALAAIEAMGCGNGPMLFPWPHSRKDLHATARGLLQAAGIDPNRRLLFHSLRQVYCEREWLRLQEGGAA